MQKDLVRALVTSGVLHSERIIHAFEAIDRVDFVPEELRAYAYRDEPLFIGAGQTISQPYTVAFMLEELEPKEGDAIFEVGFGSGWQTCLLAHIVGQNGHVVAYERVMSLYRLGRTNIAKYQQYTDGVVELHHGDAQKASAGSFHKIIAAASFLTCGPPKAWERMLVPGGKMVLPIRNSIYTYTKNEDGLFAIVEHPGFAFVPLLEGEIKE